MDCKNALEAFRAQAKKNNLTFMLWNDSWGQGQRRDIYKEAQGSVTESLISGSPRSPGDVLGMTKGYNRRFQDSVVFH